MAHSDMAAKSIHHEARLIGANIRLHRDRAGLSQRQLADLYGCEPNFISQLETGKKPAGLKARQKLARIFNCSPQDLLPGAFVQDQAEPYALTPNLTLGLACRTVRTIHAYLAEKPRKLSPQQHADLLQKILEHCLADQEEPDARLVQAYLRLI